MPETEIANVELWDHDKAEAMAYLLMSRTEFPDILESQQERLGALETKRLGILEKSAQRSIDLVTAEITDKRTLPLRLRAVSTRAILEETEVEIELIELHDKQTAQATESSDELLQEYSRFYDTNPERFAAMTGEEFGEHVQKVDDLRGFISKADESLMNLTEIVRSVGHFEEVTKNGKQPRIDWALVEVTRDQFKYELRDIFGKDSDEARLLAEEYQALNDASYASLTPKAFVEAYCALSRKWNQLIVDAKTAKEAELEALLGS